MKRIVCASLIILLFVVSTGISVFAESPDTLNSADEYEISLMRAGGGGSGGGGGGGGGGGSTGGSSGHYYSNGRGSVLRNILSFISFACFACAATIIFRLKLSKYRRNTKKLMSMLEKQDNAWKYKNIQKQVYNTYHIVQKSWSNLNMEPARAYMSEELFESFQIKLNWMEYRNQKNVLEKIKLLDAIPVSVYDNIDDSLDYVWFYIKGRMVDYIIDTQTNFKVSGSSAAENFEEYWQFVRREDGRWVLNKILQKDESDKIIFAE